MDLVKFLSPKHVMLVHGEKPKMASLKGRIQSELGIPCYDPANNDILSIPSTHYVKAVASDTFIRSCIHPNFEFLKSSSGDEHDSGLEAVEPMPKLQVSDERVAEGMLIIQKSKKAKIVHQEELSLKLGEKKQKVECAYCCPVHLGTFEETKRNDVTSTNDKICMDDRCFLLEKLAPKLSNELPVVNIQNLGEHLQVGSFLMYICTKHNCPNRIGDDSPQNRYDAVYFCCTWLPEDEKIARKIISILENFT